jgi:GntR family transcriptional regulator, rspAB operon transcriptional repressor
MIEPNSIADKLRSEIISGVLQESQPLREIALTERFKVGRSIIRKVLLQLTNEGLVETKRNFGSSVTNYNNDAIINLVIPLRKTVEVYALSQYFNKINEDDLNKWEKCLENMEKSCKRNDYYKIAEEDINFHRIIVEQSEVFDVILIWNTLVNRVRGHFVRNYKKKYKNCMEIYYEHNAIFNMFKTGKKEMALKILESNIE